MKKIWISLLAVVLMLNTVITPAKATDVKCDLEEIGISISFPKEYIVVTKGADKNDPVFAEIEMTEAEISELLDWYEANNIYLDATSRDYSSEIVVTVMPYTGKGFNEMSENEFDKFIEDFSKGYEGQNVPIQGHEIYQHSQTKFIKVYATYDEMPAIQYTTICSDMILIINFYARTELISEEQEKVINSVVDSIVFENLLQKPVEKVQDDSLIPSLDLPEMEEIQAEIEAEMKAEQALSRSRQESNFIGKVGAGVIVAAVGGMIAFIRNKKKAKKENEPVEDEQEWRVDRAYSAVAKTDINHDTKLEQIPQAPRYICCPSCGAPLAADSEFCHTCGARVDN